MMGWFGYAAGWLAAAFLWTLASASSAGRQPLETLPYGLLTMGTGAILGVGVWHLTGTLPWRRRGARFFLIHAGALSLYAATYAISWTFPDLIAGRFSAAIAAGRSSPVLIWNLLMGSWLYLVVAGFGYAIRGDRQVRAEAAAASEAQVLAQQARLAALRARVNPHFLFNALHSVGALIRADPRAAEQAIEGLGDMLRYVLRNDEEVRFAEEWGFTLAYLAMEGLRLGDRLVIDATADPATRTVMIPPLLLQPIVENAVRHGIAQDPDGGTLVVRAAIAGNRLRLTVLNDEVPFETVTGLGVGLTSVRSRLAARYGDRAHLSLQRDQGRVSVTVEVELDESVEPAA